MSVKKFAVGCFDDEDRLLAAVHSVRKAGYKIHDVYTPMPVHGLDEAIGHRETSLHTASFIYGMIGMIGMLAFIAWALMDDWPWNLGGKPHDAWIAWIAITFEVTILSAAVGVVITFCYLCQLGPFVKKHRFNLRSTDDLFVMVLECMPKTNEAEVLAFLESIGAMEINIQVAEDGWWFGTYDKEQTLYQIENEPPFVSGNQQ